MGTIIYSGKRDSPQGAPGTWAVTDQTDDYSLDCDSDDANLGDNLGTLIKELIKMGILKGSVVEK